MLRQFDFKSVSYEIVEVIDRILEEHINENVEESVSDGPHHKFLVFDLCLDDGLNAVTGDFDT